MVAFKILEPIIAILLFGCLISQCVVPELLGEPWFPIFRRIWKVRRDISQANEVISTVALEDKLTELKSKGEKNGIHPEGPAGPDPGQRP